MKRNLLSSWAIVTFFSVLDRLLSFLFKIFTSRTLGAENMGIYQIGFSFFSVLLCLVNGGIPMIVSKMTARAYRDPLAQNRVAGSALVLSLGIAILLTGGFFALFAPLEAIVGDTVVLLVGLMIPTLVLSAAYSSLRGALWGKEKFFLVSVLEVIEQLGRIGMCVALFLLGFPVLNAVALSLTAGSLIATIFCVLFFASCGGRFRFAKAEFLTVSKSNAPLTLSRVVGTLSGSVTALVVPKLFVLSGYTQSQANALLGASFGMAMPILYVPITLVASLAFLLTPKIGGLTDNKRINESVSGALRFSLLVACCFAPFFSGAGKEICRFVYADEVSGVFLQFMGWSLIPLTLESITTSVMNSLDLELKSFRNSMIGYGALWVVALLFFGNYTVELLGFGLGLSWVITTLLNLLSIRKKTGLSFDFAPVLLKSALLCYPSASFASCLVALTKEAGGFLSLAASGLGSATFFLVLSLIFDSFRIHSVTRTRTREEKRKRLRRSIM